MVQAMINIDKHTNKILNIVKAKYDLENKSEAIQAVVKKYEENILEPEFKPEFIEEIKQIEKEGKFIKVKDVDKYFAKLGK